jgi:DNA primase
MSSSSVEKIKDRLGIVDVIGAYIKLDKSGTSFKGKCPFHNEKTPSFFVSPDRGGYYCFGCGAKGDIFTFVQEFEGLDFVGALKVLAERAGVELEQVSPLDKAKQNQIRSATERAMELYVASLNSNKGPMDYLLQRGLEEKTIKEWSIGYAPLSWRKVSEQLRKEGYSEDLLIKSGLIKKSEAASSAYDIFRGRIIFPIFDPSGNVIAFSGRLYDEQPDAPKYLNSPETEFFIKSEALYGFDRAKTHIRKKGYAMVVEGQMDLLFCHQSGFENTVATSGTALTTNHLEKLKRISPKILFVFDGDKAGIAAAQKSAEMAISLGMEAKVALLPEGKDPADVLSEDKELFVSVLRSSTHVIDFALAQVVASGGDSRQIARLIGEKVLPLVAKVPSLMEQSHFVSLIAKRVGIKEEAIWIDLRRIAKDPDIKKIDNVAVIETKKKEDYTARRLWGIVFWQSQVREPFIDVNVLKSTLVGIVGEERWKEIEGNFEPQTNEIIFEVEAYYGSKEALEKDIKELLIHFEEDHIREALVMVMNKLQNAELTNDSSIIESMNPRLTELMKRRNELADKRKNL